MTKEELMEAWKGEDFVEICGTLVPKSIAGAIKADRAGERDRNRKEIHEAAKATMAEILPELAERQDFQYTKASDMFKQILEAVKTSGPVADKKPKETPEQVEARLRNEFAATNAKREQESKIGSAYQRIMLAAAGKIDPTYAEAFEYQARKLFAVEIGENGEPYFKKGDVPFYDGDKPAGADKVAAELMKQYPKFLSAGIPGPDLRGQTTTTVAPKGEAQYDPLGAAFKEKIMGSK